MTASPSHCHAASSHCGLVSVYPWDKTHCLLHTYAPMGIFRGERSERVGLKVSWEWTIGTNTQKWKCMWWACECVQCIHKGEESSITETQLVCWVVNVKSMEVSQEIKNRTTVSSQQSHFWVLIQRKWNGYLKEIAVLPFSLEHYSQIQGMETT